MQNKEKEYHVRLFCSLKDTDDESGHHFQEKRTKKYGCFSALCSFVIHSSFIEQHRFKNKINILIFLRDISIYLK